MLKVALRGIRAHLVRFVMSLLAVALGVAFVAGTFALRTMLGSTFDGIVDASITADVYVRTAPEAGTTSGAPGLEGGGTPIPLALRDVVAAADGVAVVLPEVQGSVVLVGADGTAVAAGQAPSFGLPYSPQDPALTIVDGVAPQGDGEIVLESAALAASGLAVGDTTTVVIAGEVRQVEIVGEATFAAPAAGATIVLLPEDVALEAFGANGVPQLAVHAADGVEVTELAERVQEQLASSDDVPDGVEAITGAQLAQENKAAIGEMLGFVTTFLLVFAAIALFVGAFIITNTFTMSVRQRMREFALLRAVGASPGQVFASILVQAAVVGVIGSLIGLAGGLGLVEVLRAVLGRVGMSLSGEIPFEVSTAVVALSVGTLVSIAAAALPARRAALVPPVEAMREEVAATEASLRGRTIAGVALLVLGAGAVIVATQRPEASGVETWLGGGAAAVVIGMLVVAPGLARATIRALAWPFVRLVPPMGRLARGNVVRNPRRTASTAGALMIGMALVGAATVIASTTQASLAGVVRNEVASDLVVRGAAGSVPLGAARDLAALPEVAVADVAGFVPGEVTDDGGSVQGLGPTFIAGFSPETLERSLLVTVDDGDIASLRAGDAVVTAARAQEHGWAVGDTLTLTGPTGSADVEIGAVVTSNTMGATVTVSLDVLETIAPADQLIIDTVFVSAADGVDVEAARDAVAKTVAPYIVVSVLTQEEFISSIASQVDQILVILYALLGLSIVIAVLGIVNTLALSVIERTREIGLLRAVGLGRLQLAGTVTIESVLTSVFGTVVGLVVGVALASSLPSVYAQDGLSELSIPWPSLVGMLVLAVVVGVLAAVWPAVRAARLRVLDAVSYE